MNGRDLGSLALSLAIGGLLVGLGTWAGGSGLQIGGWPLWGALVALAVGINWLAWVPAAIARTERFYDLVGSLTYLSLTAAALGVAAAHRDLDARDVVTAAMVAVWAVRLGTFLLRRVLRDGKDGRFDTLKTRPLRFLATWTIQALWVGLTLSAALAIWTRSQGGASVSAVAVGGWVLWGIGFGVEVVADRQKRVFRADPDNAGQWIDGGLWAWSRHPNYVGEILLWTGICVAGADLYTGSGWVALLSPAVVYLLLTRVSGVPLLEARADARWGGQPGYEQYKARTPVLWPRPPTGKGR